MAVQQVPMLCHPLTCLLACDVTPLLLVGRTTIPQVSVGAGQVGGVVFNEGRKEAASTAAACTGFVCSKHA